MSIFVQQSAFCSLVDNTEIIEQSQEQAHASIGPTLGNTPTTMTTLQKLPPISGQETPLMYILAF